MSADAPDTFASDFIKVLMVIYDKFDLMDFAGPQEVLYHTRHEMSKSETEAFDITIVGAGKLVRSSNGVEIATHIDFKEAHERLDEYVQTSFLPPADNEIKRQLAHMIMTFV